MASRSVVFLPGFMCDARVFAPQITRLSDAGLDCRLGDLTRADTVDDMARDVLRDAPDRFALVGLSMGAIVAFALLRQQPQRVTHLAALNTTAREDAAGDARRDQLARVAAGDLDRVLREELKPHYLADANRDPAILAVLDAMGRSLGDAVFARQTKALATRRAAFDMLARIRCPTLVLAGAQDRVCPIDRHEEIAAAIPGARLTILPACGHISSLEQPEAVTDALRALLAEPGAEPGAGLEAEAGTPPAAPSAPHN